MWFIFSLDACQMLQIVAACSLVGIHKLSPSHHLNIFLLSVHSTESKVQHLIFMCSPCFVSALKKGPSVGLGTEGCCDTEHVPAPFY
jgi:hypothetical protein